MTVPQSHDIAEDLAEIQKVYERLGLTTAHDRLRFAEPEQKPKNQFKVVISDTSNPF